ncbi:TPA: hypothetical protein RL773_004573, partial [Escherichia coli]|nr:hypothetical protein [Escherichia coli]
MGNGTITWKTLFILGGAINIIYPMNKSGYIGTKLFLPKQVDEIKAGNVPVNNYILSVITHAFNGYNKKLHLSPANVRAKRQRDDNISFRQRLNELKDGAQYEALLDEVLLEFEEFKAASEELELDYLKRIEELDAKHDAVVFEKNKIEVDLERLKYDIRKYHGKATDGDVDVDVEKIISLISNRLNPESVLSLLEILIPNNVEILKSAFSSARNSS